MSRERWMVTLFVLLPCTQLPARADIFVSHGAGGPLSSTVSSFSQYTGAAKLTFNGLVWSEGMAFGPDGNLYVADQSTGSVLRFNPSTAALLGTFTPPVSPSAAFAITFGPDGSLYMADNLGYIRRYDGSSGAPTGTFSCAPPSGGTCYPFGLTFGPDGNLYVSDLSSRGVLKFNGSTLAYMSVFVPAMGSPTSTFAWGLHFGPNGNLYVAFSQPPGNVYDILEFNGSNGAFIAAFLATGLVNADFAFGPDTEIYAANNYGFQRFSSSTGSLLSTFGSVYNGTAGFIVMGGPVPSVPPYVTFNPVTVTPLQKVRLTVVNGPVRVPPGVPVQAYLLFQSKSGARVGPISTVNLNPGQSASLDLDASTIISSGILELRPTVVAVPGTPLGSLQGSAEVFTTSTGIGSVFYSGIPMPPSFNITGPPSFVPQGVAYGQSILMTALAPPDSPCAALLSFSDANGNPVGPTQNVNLSPGTMASLSFNPNSLTQPGRQEFIPQMAPMNAPGIASACMGSAEVLSQGTGAIATYQTSSPAVGTAAPAN